MELRKNVDMCFGYVFDVAAFFCLPIRLLTTGRPKKTHKTENTSKMDIKLQAQLHRCAQGAKSLSEKL